LAHYCFIPYALSTGASENEVGRRKASQTIPCTVYKHITVVMERQVASSLHTHYHFDPYSFEKLRMRDVHCGMYLACGKGCARARRLLALVVVAVSQAAGSSKWLASSWQRRRRGQPASARRARASSTGEAQAHTRR